MLAAEWPSPAWVSATAARSRRAARPRALPDLRRSARRASVADSRQAFPLWRSAARRTRRERRPTRGRRKGLSGAPEGLFSVSCVRFVFGGRGLCKAPEGAGGFARGGRGSPRPPRAWSELPLLAP